MTYLSPRYNLQLEADFLIKVSRGSVVVSKYGLYGGGPGSIPTAVTTMSAAGGDAEHVSLKSLTCSTIPRCKIGTGKT